MDYEKFKQDMEQDVLKNLANRGIEAETDVRHIDKLNDGYDALTVKAPGSVIGVNINLSSAFETYEDGRDYIDIVERASDQAAKGITESKSFDIDKVNDYDQMKQTLSMEVVSAERNADMLEKVPHKNIEDMAVVYRFVLDTSDEGRASILVTNQLLDSYGITADQLHEDAMTIAPELRPAVIKTMSETLQEMMGDEAFMMMGMPIAPPENEPLFVATVPDKVQGASVLAYQDFMEQAAERIGGDFYVLPSSIHEILLVRDDGSMNRADLEDMVRTVNATEVQPEDILTDSVYHYDSKDKVFELAEKFEERTAAKQRESALDKLADKKREAPIHESVTRPHDRGGEAL